MSAPVGVVLAAGASSRMGRPKATLPWRGRRFVDHCVAALRGCAHVWVVEGAHPLGDVEGATVLVNPRWRDGQLGSLQAGLARVARDVGVIVHTVDRPHVRADTVDALIEAHRRWPSGLWQPRHAGRRGHPLAVPPDIVAALESLPPTGTARDVVRAHADRRRFVDVDDPAVLDNLDRTEDLARLPT